MNLLIGNKNSENNAQLLFFKLKIHAHLDFHRKCETTEYETRNGMRFIQKSEIKRTDNSNANWSNQPFAEN